MLELFQNTRTYRIQSATSGTRVAAPPDRSRVEGGTQASACRRVFRSLTRVESEPKRIITIKTRKRSVSAAWHGPSKVVRARHLISRACGRWPQKETCIWKMWGSRYGAHRHALLSCSQLPLFSALAAASDLVETRGTGKRRRLQIDGIFTTFTYASSI